MSGATWDSTRKHARALESRIEAKLTAYSGVASQIAANNGGSSRDGASSPRNRDIMSLEEEGIGGYKLMEEEIEELLDKLSSTLDSLTALLNSPDVPPSTSMLHAASRHRDIYDDYRREFVRTRANIEQTLQRHDLLGSIRKDINAYKQSLPPQTDALLAERSRIDSSNRMTDEILDQAYATREDFAQQRTMLTGVNSRMTGVLSSMPGINSLLSMIQSRRRRDTLILGLVTGVCVIALLGYLRT
ncbi:protein transport protein gos1 [Naganishia albida]|nr:protein transport protein gos1 [Naganishia albida]